MDSRRSFEVRTAWENAVDRKSVSRAHAVVHVQLSNLTYSVTPTDNGIPSAPDPLPTPSTSASRQAWNI